MSGLAHQITLEQGYADVYNEHLKPKTHAPHQLPPWLQRWENVRPRWAMELLAETTGVFFYTFPGVGATVSFMVSTIAKESGYGDVLTIGFAYGLGIAFAILVSAPTSGGHLSPAYTISFALFKGFPWRKVPQYILAQILGAFLACYMVYIQYKQQLQAYATELEALGPARDAIMFSPQGPAGALALFPSAGQNMGYVFVNELMASTLLAILVFSVLDSSNFFIAFTSAPLLIGAGYAVIVWGFAVDTVVLNTARDLGGRFAAAGIFGAKAFTFNKKYTAIAALTNILGTFLGALFQTLFLMDSSRPVVNPAPEGSVEGREIARRATVMEKEGGEGALRKRPTTVTVGTQRSDGGSGSEKV